MKGNHAAEPRIDPTAAVKDSKLGVWTAVGARTLIQETVFGDYSYVSNDCDIIYSQIGKFCSIASRVRINPGNHPLWRAALHHFTYRSRSYALHSEDDHGFFGWRRAHPVVPRVPALEAVMEKLLALGIYRGEAKERSQRLLLLLGIPESLWSISPTTFSGGEQQRINLALGFVYPYPVLLLDEPTASLDEKNRKVAVDLIRGARDRGAAVIGTFHDPEVLRAVATRIVEMPEKGRMR